MIRPRLLVTVVIAIAVIGVAAWFLWPTAKDTTTSAATAGPYLVRLDGEAPKVGVNTLVVEISGNGGQPPPPDSVTFEPVMPQMGHATRPVVAAEDGAGRYRGDVDLSMAGQWEITVRISASDQVHQAVLNVTTSG
ncbi:hypothetical protein CIW52_18385 [Mycolicibacterium sp. P9-64]|uniref:FixH family protein n=1 Tax=Mycolicibacterium sp. P9-64 TaxID=2024612 RepID=UPI0011ECDAA6|nr:FixH family protein [Mycolicibacterium sp. P9-64]KAA0081707.1 hypothetical protein CIW52_18385 [Mycolicibacterium sp. P9-64]